MDHTTVASSGTYHCYPRWYNFHVHNKTKYEKKVVDCPDFLKKKSWLGKPLLFGIFNFFVIFSKMAAMSKMATIFEDGFIVQLKLLRCNVDQQMISV